MKRTGLGRAKGRLARKLAGMQRGELMREEFEASLRAVFAHWKHGTTFRMRTKVLRDLGIGRFDEADEEPETPG